MKKFFTLIMLALFTSVGVLSASTGVYDTDVGKHVKDVFKVSADVDFEKVIFQSNSELTKHETFVGTFILENEKAVYLNLLTGETLEDWRQRITLNLLCSHYSKDYFKRINAIYANPEDTLIKPGWCKA